NEGKYTQHSNSGKTLLAHELTHVVQQNQTQFSRSILHRKNGDEPESTATSEGELLFKVSIKGKGPLNPDQILVITLMQIFGLNANEASQMIQQKLSHWTSRVPTDKDLKQGFINVTMNASKY